MFDSDYFEHFINYTENKIYNLVSNGIKFYLHINIKSVCVFDLYYYDKILKFAELIHKFTENLINIYIYESSNIFLNLIPLLNNSLKIDINRKIIFESKNNYCLKFEVSNSNLKLQI